MTEIRTLEDVARHNEKIASWRQVQPSYEARTKPVEPRKEYTPIRERRKGPNRLETAYGKRLDVLQRTGEILDYAYERVTLKLAHDCRLTVDWHVIAADGVTEFHECKGPHAWEDSIIKLKVAATQFPHYRFFLVKKDRLGFTVKRVVSVPQRTSGEA